MKNLTFIEQQEIFKGIRCGMQQYLRNVKGWTYQSIASLMFISTRSVWNHCNGDYSIKQFEDRTDDEMKNYERIYNTYLTI